MLQSEKTKPQQGMRSNISKSPGGGGGGGVVGEEVRAGEDLRPREPRGAGWGVGGEGSPTRRRGRGWGHPGRAMGG